ncbi:MAG TPA: DUF2599 domain-containing protein [Stenotrophomonas sp.]|jgi:hypothetical protein
MTLLPKILTAILAGSALAPTAPAHADIGSDTAQLLTMMYRDTRQDCGSPSLPAYLCSGVMLRATTPSTAYQFYSISPSAQKIGGVSVSYLRQDAKYQHLAYRMTSGFIFDNALDNPGDHVDHQPRCAFPIDGATNSRADGGCGDYQRNDNVAKIVEGYCDKIGVTTAEQWVNRYFTANGSYRAQSGMFCAFDIRSGKAGAAQAFYQNIRAQSLLADRGLVFNNGEFQENELILAPWQIEVPRSPSILAAFYVNESGVAGARLSQVQWYLATGQVLPAIALALPASRQQDARFTYQVAKQAILPISEAKACERYVQSARWLNRYDPGFKKNLMSLEVTPTQCGRQTQANQTNHFFNELVASRYLDPEWVNNADNKTDNIRGMRRQLVCAMNIARNQPSWLLEPSRPNTTHEKAMASGCNHATG